MLTYALAVLAACANAVSSVLQRKANKRVPQRENMSRRQIWVLLHQPVWFGGILAITAGFLLQASALGTGQLAVVEPVLVLELPFTLLLAARVFRQRLGPREWLPAAAMTAGLAALLYLLAPSAGGPPKVHWYGWLAGIGGNLVLVGFLVLWARRGFSRPAGGENRPPGGSLQTSLLAVAAGSAFGLTAALMKAMTGTFHDGIAHAFTDWPIYAMVATGVLGFFLTQTAMNAGQLIAAQPGLTLSDPLISVLWGVLAFHEEVRQGWYILGEVASAGVIVAGVVMLARSRLLAEDDSAGEGDQPADGDRSSGGIDLKMMTDLPWAAVKEMDTAGIALTHRLYQAMWAALGGSGDGDDLVTFVNAEVLPGPFAVSPVGAAAFAAVGAAVADLVSTVTGRTPAVRVDRRLVSVWLTRWSASVGWDRGTPWHDVSTDYAAADGRWVRLQANYDHLRRAAAAALGAAPDRAAFARAIAALPADEAERVIVDGGGAAAASRTLTAWAAHPQGQAVAAEPLVDTSYGPGGSADWAPTPERPLAGIRVLDVTRVLAGPVGTRTLAGYGAEVLRIDPPGFLEPGGSNGGGDLTLGKRCVYLDLRTTAGRDTFLTLLSQADVLVHGLRDGALDGLGLGADVRRDAAPEIIEVTLNAYGWTGPWQRRRGFDTLVQTSTGLSTELMRRGDLAGPRLLPSQVLDFATGYLAAAAAIRGLADRVRRGRWSSWRLALARTGTLLLDAGEAPAETALGDPADDWYEDRVYTFPKGPVRRLAFPTAVEHAPQFWERAGDPYGTATPVWATAPGSGRVGR